MNIKVYVVGDKIERMYSDGIKEYEKRLSRYCKIKLQHFKNEEQLLKKISIKSYRLSISTTGKAVTSEELAENINQLGIAGLSDITFIIGSEEVSCDEQLAISSMEMEIGIKTLIMFEQIYRSFRILNNEPYHK